MDNVDKISTSLVGSYGAVNPLVSVITPVFNAEKYLVACVESILAQTYGTFELFLVDDASTDSSPEIMKSLAERDRRIKLLFLEQNGGAARARNKGLELANGVFIAFVDADDLWSPEKLNRQLISFSLRPELGIIGTNGRIIDSHGNLQHRCIRAEKIRCGRVSLADFILQGLPLMTSSVVVRRECLEQHGFFKEMYRLVEDYELWMRIVPSHEVEIIDEELIFYRQHDSNSSANSFNVRYHKIQVFENEVLPKIETLGDQAGAFILKLQRMYISLGRMFAKAGKSSEADFYYAKAFNLGSSRLMCARAFFYRTINRLSS